jgi:hypothetical protein
VIYYVTAGTMSLDCETRVFTWSRVSGLNVLAGVGAQLADLADHAAGVWRNEPGVIAPVT